MPDFDDLNPHPSESDSMPMYEETLAQARTGSVEVSALPHRPTITELLTHKKNSLEHELDLVNKALAKAKENEGAMALMDAVAKTRVHG